jgi:hypothetical protein
MRRPLTVITIAVGAVIVPGSSASGAVVRSGLHGTITRGPIAPVCVAEQPCTAPAAGAVIAFSRGLHVARVTVRPDGSYRVLLPPGLYAVRALRGPIEPIRVRVLPGRNRAVDFSIDTGIR